MHNDTTGQAEDSELNSLSQHTLYRMWFILVISVGEFLEMCVVAWGHDYIVPTTS